MTPRSGPARGVLFAVVSTLVFLGLLVDLVTWD
jgi:hypothetical protein